MALVKITKKNTHNETIEITITQNKRGNIENMMIPNKR